MGLNDLAEEAIARISAVLVPCPTKGCPNSYLPYESGLSEEDRRFAQKLGISLPALSRKDNKTYVCSACGTQEALDDFMRPGR